MKKYKIIPLLALLVFVSIACAGIQIKDPVKVGLYTIKESWIEIRSYVIKENLNGRLSNEALDNFKTKDNKFQQYYDLAVYLYLKDEQPDKLDSAINTLRDMLLEARRTHYKEI